MQPSGMVTAVGLTRRFGPVTAVDRLDLSVGAGEIFGLVGPDGAGKTTTMRLLCGLMHPTSGDIRVAGCDVRRQGDAIKDRIGYMAQKFGLYVDLTVRENMHFYADLFGIGRSERASLMGDLLAMTRMEPFRDRPAGKLSGGMKQKLSLMCTLLHRPEVLFLDEPTNGVDPVSRRDFWAILYQLVRDGITVVITTAYLDEAERCNRVAFMHHGRLIRCDSPHALRTKLDETCWEMAAPDLHAVQSRLVEIPGVLSAEPAGSALHVFLIPSQTNAEDVIRALESRGAGPVQARRIVPSLEDVFIASIRKAEGEQARSSG